MVDRNSFLLFLSLSLAPFWNPSALFGQAENPKGRRLWPTNGKWRHAALRALRDSGTWGPAAGAFLVGLGHWDDDISDWAVENTPIFGSRRNALKASNELRLASHIGMIVTTFLISADEDRWKVRFKTFLLQQVSAISTSSATRLLKESTGRRRPDGSDNRSFPSGHSSRAFTYRGAASRNLEAAHLSEGARTGLNLTLTTIAAGTAWARVEGGVHFPSDVLAGAALGNFISLLLNDAFLAKDNDLLIQLNLDRNHSVVAIRFCF